MKRKLQCQLVTLLCTLTPLKHIVPSILHYPSLIPATQSITLFKDSLAVGLVGGPGKYLNEEVIQGNTLVQELSNS